MIAIAFILSISALSAPPAAGANPESSTTPHAALGAARDFVGTWEYHWGDIPPDSLAASTGAESAARPAGNATDWQFLGPQAIPRPQGRNGQRFLWLRTPLAGPEVAEPTLHIGPINQIFEAFVNGQLVYRFGTLDGEGPDARRFLGYPMHLIPLPRDYQGHILTLRIYSQHIIIGPAAAIRIGSKPRLIRDAVIHDFGKLIVGSVLCAIGLFVLGLYLSERQERAYLYYAGFAFTMGVWLVCQMRSRHLLLAVPLLWTHLEYFALYTAAVFMALFLGRVLGRGLLGLMPVIAGIFIAYDLSMAVLVATGAVTIMRTLVWFEVGLLPIITYFLLSIGILLRQGSSDARLFAAGFMVAMALAAYDIMGALGLLPRAPFSLTNFGQGGFVVSLGLILVRRFRRVHSDLLVTKQELSEKLQALQVRNSEIENLNVELRHQIQARSSLMLTSLIEDNGSSKELAPILPAGALLNDRYRVIRIVGQGAMGVVYEVERVHDGRHFAAKVLSGRSHRKELARFAREAQLLARLQHENLVAIADIDMTGNRQAYIIMEFVAGTTLADQSAHYGELGFVLPVLRQLADALAVVHAAGIVHRELIPPSRIVV